MKTVWLKEKPLCCDDSFDELIDEKLSFNLVNAAFHVRHQVRGIHPLNL